MYQYPPRSRSPSAHSVISPGSTPRPGLISTNSSASMQQPSSYAQYYSQPASYYQQQHPSLHSYAPRSISNPHIASSSMARPNSLYNLSIMSPTPSGNKSAFTYTPPPPPQSPLTQHNAAAAFSSNANTYDSSASPALAPEYRRRSMSASGIIVSDQLPPPVVSSAPKPDRYHRRRKTSDSASVTSVAASTAAASSSPLVESTDPSSEPRPIPKHLSASADSVINYKKQSALHKGLKNSASTPSLTDYKKPATNSNREYFPHRLSKSRAARDIFLQHAPILASICPVLYCIKGCAAHMASISKAKDWLVLCFI